MKNNIVFDKVKIYKLLKKIRNIMVVLLIIIIFINLCLWDTSIKSINIFNKVGIAIVVSDSMEPTLSKNDLIVVKKKKDYYVGDIIVYKVNNKLVIHRIVRIEESEVITKGDANEFEDKSINMDDIYGKLDFSIPVVGNIVSFFKTSYGGISVIFIIVIIFVYSCRIELKNMSKK